MSTMSSNQSVISNDGGGCCEKGGKFGESCHARNTFYHDALSTNESWRYPFTAHIDDKTFSLKEI